MRYLRLLSMFFAYLMSACSQAHSIDPALDRGKLYTYTVKDLTGKEVKLETYRGKVILFVNTASRCGFTSQYEGLEKLYVEFKDKDFVILGFPSNDFGGQEPGSNEDIAHFCKLNFGVTFPMFQKAPVSGQAIQPLYKYLTHEANPGLDRDVAWNFEKLLVDRKGRLRGRFTSFVKPGAKELRDSVEEVLAEAP